MEITNDADYQSALSKIIDLMDSDPPLDSPEGEQLKQLAEAVVDYEHRTFGFPDK